MSFKSVITDIASGQAKNKISDATERFKQSLVAPVYKIPFGIGSTLKEIKDKRDGTYNVSTNKPAEETLEALLDAETKVKNELSGLNTTLKEIKGILQQQTNTFNELLDDAEKQESFTKNESYERPTTDSTAKTGILGKSDSLSPDSNDGILARLEHLGEGFLGLKGIIGIIGGGGLLDALAALSVAVTGAVGTISLIAGMKGLLEWIEGKVGIAPEPGDTPSKDLTSVEKWMERMERKAGIPESVMNFGRPKGIDASGTPISTTSMPKGDATPTSPTEYINTPDGKVVKKTGGSHSWRNNNPGNIKGGSFATEHGATGEDTSGFAVFPSEETGDTARRDLLFGPNSKYKNLSVSEAIARYTRGDPPEQIKAYQETVLKAVNGDDALLKDLPENEKTAMLDAMKNHEGWKVGKEEVIKPASLASSTDPPRHEGAFPGPSGDGKYLATGGKPPMPDAEYVPPKINTGKDFHEKSKEKTEASHAPIIVPVPTGGGGGGSGGVVPVPVGGGSSGPTIALGSSPPPNSIDINNMG